MKKRVVAALLCGVMIMGLVAGCGNNGSENAGNLNEEESAYNIIMQFPVVGDAPEILPDVEAVLNEIVSEEINATVTLEPVDAFNLANETSLAVSSGEKLDLCLSLFSGVGSLVNSGSIIEISDLLENYGAGIIEACGRQIAGGAYGDGQYAVPVGYVDGQGVSFVANKSILDKYGITIDPEKIYSIDELEDIFATVKAGEGDSFYMMAGGYSTLLPLGALYSYDNIGGGCGLVFDQGFDSTEVVNFYASDMYAEYADRMYDWAQAGYYSPDASTTTETAASQIATGKYLGTFMNDAGNAAVETGQQAGVEMVSIKTRQPIATTDQFQSVLWSISTTSENPEKTMEFLNLLYTMPELANLLMYGIEGESYETVEESDEGTVIQVNGMQFCQFGVFGDRLTWDIVSPNPITLNSDLQAYSDSVEIYSPALGFVCDFTNVSSQYSAVNSVIQQYQAIINTGAIDPEQELPEFLNALDSAGIDVVLEEVQTQFDEWLSQQ